MSDESKILTCYFFALILSILSFVLLALSFPYPHQDPAVKLLYLPWVSNNLALYAPYKYWYPSGLLCIPGVGYIIWRIVCIIRNVRLKPQTALRWKKVKVPVLSPAEAGAITALLIFVLINFSYGAFYQFFFNYHHLNFITGPLNDVLNGKYLLLDTHTQYGFLNILLTSWLFRAGLYFSHANVHLISMIMLLVEYFLIYYLLRLFTGSKGFSLLGIIIVITANFYGYFPALFPSEIYVWPGNCSWRFFPVVPSLTAIMLWQKSRRKGWLALSQALVATGLLWNIEIGLALFIAYIACELTAVYLGPDKLKVKAIVLIKRLVGLAAWLLMFITFYSVFLLVKTGSFPEWPWLYRYVFLFNHIGFLQTVGHAPPPGLNYWPVMIYLGTILIAIIRPYIKRGPPANDMPLLVMLAVYGYGIFSYYMGKQDLSDLATVSVPSGILAGYWLYRVYLALKRTLIAKHLPPSLAILPILIMLLPVLSKFFTYAHQLFLYRRENYRDIMDGKYGFPPKNRITTLENKAVLTIPINELMLAAETIKAYVPAGQKAAVLGHFDHVLLMQAERTNLAEYSYFSDNIHSVQEYEEVVDLYQQADYLFVDKNLLRDMAYYSHNCHALGECTIVKIFSAVRDKFRYIESSGMIYVYKRS